LRAVRHRLDELVDVLQRRHLLRRTKYEQSASTTENQTVTMISRKNSVYR
jgi:hypothetical protein